MTNFVATTDNLVESYLDRLDNALKGVSPLEKKDILNEIRAHILDSISGATDHDLAVDRVLRLLGSPEELAARYNAESMLVRAGHSFSPWLLMRTTWRWAKIGTKGFLAFMLGLFGYGTAFAMSICALLKPVMPERVGAWWGPGGFNIGVASHVPGTHEVLGQWFVPVITVFAFVSAVATTQALRWLIQKRTPRFAH